MKRNFLIKILSLIMVVCAGLTLIACAPPSDNGNQGGGGDGGNSAVVIPGWQNEVTRTVDLGDIVSVGNPTVEDEDGNIYFCDYVIKDSKGVVVTPISGEFEITDKAGYTITCTVVISDTDKRVQIIKVKITDTDAPVIKFNAVNTGFIGREYTLPEIVISDLSGDEITPEIKVYKVVDETTQTEIALQNNKFTPTEKGKYVLKVSATDSSNNTATAEQVFAVRDAMAENMLEDFNDSLSVLNSKNGDGVEWFDSFEGHTGVIKIPGSSNDITPYLFTFAQNKEDYKYLPFTSVKITYYASKGGSWYPTTVGIDESAQYWHSVPSATWNTWEITNIVDWNLFYTTGTNGTGAQLFWSWTKDMDVYIDEITFTASPNITIVPDKTEGGAGDTISVSAFVENDNRFTPTISVKDPNGEDVAVTDNKFTVSMYGDYVITATINDSNYPYYKSTKTAIVKCLTNYIKYDAYLENYELGNEITINDAVWFNPSTESAVDNSNVTYVVKHGEDEVTISDGKFTPSVAGIYTVTYTATVGADQVSYTVAEILVLEPIAGANVLSNFRDASSTAQFVSANATWLPEYQGKAGVVKVQSTESGGIINYWFKSNAISSSVIAAGDWDYLEIEYYMPVGKWLFSGGIDLVTYSKVNQWATIKISKAQINGDTTLTGFANQITGGGYNLLWAWYDGVAIDALYFNSVKLGKFDVVGQGSYTFDGPMDNDNFTNGSEKIGEWVDEFQGKTGVVQLNVDNGGWANLYIRARNLTAEEVKNGDWDYLEIVIYTTNARWLYWNYNGGTPLNVQSKANDWSTIRIERSLIETYGTVASFASSVTGSNGTCVLIAESLGDIYVDSIKFCKNA